MKVTRLNLANVRALGAAEFRFRPGFNVIVGVNGAGKTTVLDALGICLAGVLRQANGLRNKLKSLSSDDLRVGADALTIECHIDLDGTGYTYLVHNPRETSVARGERAGEPRAQVYDTPATAEFVGDTPPRLTTPQDGRPLAMLFSTRRAVPSQRKPSSLFAAGGVAAACADAFADQRLELGHFAAWMRVQEALRAERPSEVLVAFSKAVSRFLPGYSNLRIDGESPPGLLIDRGEITLQVRQLSDGERGLLALVLDMTRRLAQANPEMTDPAADAAAVVLIDEIELHIHPKWQRRVVENLTETFPKCQFIATTHSPQVIGEVEHDRILIMADGEAYSPSHSYGVDSSRVLEEIMDTDRRTRSVDHLLSQISRKIQDGQYDDARESLAELSDRVGGNDAEVIRIQTLLDFITDEAC